MSDQISDFRLQQRDYLLKIARVMNERLDLPEVLGLVIRYAVQMTNGQAGVVAMREGEGPFKPVASYRLEEKYVHYLQPLLEQVSLSVPMSVPDELSLSWQTQSVQNNAESEMQQLAKRLPEQLEQVLALPLINQGETRGMLFVFRSEGAALFTPINNELLKSFTEQAAIAIQNAYLYGTVSVHARQLRLLYDFSVSMATASEAEQALQMAAQYAVAIGPSHWVAIFACDETGKSITRYILHPTPYAELEPKVRVELEIEGRLLLEQKEPVLFDKSSESEELPPFLADEGFQSGAAIPIAGASRPLGVLWVASRNLAEYAPETVRLLATLAHYLGLTLDKFALFEQLEARERQLSTVVEYNPAGVLLLDSAGQVLLQNPVVQALTGRPPSHPEGTRPNASGEDGSPNASGEDARTSHPEGARPNLGREEKTHVSDVLRLMDETGQAVVLGLPQGPQPTTVQGYLRGRDGSRGRYLQVGITSLLSAGGAEGTPIEGYVVNMVDLTALKEAENAKRVFLTGLSHELKTPLALIRGYAETLRYPQVKEDDELYQEALDVILDETTHLTEMVNQMLQAARLQAGVLQFEWDKVALKPFLEKVVETFRRANPNHRWEVALTEPLPATITADPTRLRELFNNLLSNAAKYSKAGTLIRVSAISSGTQVRISVRDEGIGIAPEDQKRLFQSFFRASKHIEGTGLGLYLSKAIVEAHQGTIRVESEIGKGSSFTVQLPINRSD
ncbi:MAG: ATP-binding protein [Ardenticatenaceae bacterium]